MEEENIELRYIKWKQRADKLEREMKDFSEKLDDDDYSLSASGDPLKSFVSEISDLKFELQDIICWEEVVDFLENGPGFQLDKKKK